MFAIRSQFQIYPLKRELMLQINEQLQSSKNYWFKYTKWTSKNVHCVYFSVTFLFSFRHTGLKYTFHIFRQRTVAYKSKEKHTWFNFFFFLQIKTENVVCKSIQLLFWVQPIKKKKKKPSEFVWLLNVDLTSPPVCNLISGVPEQVTSVIYHFVPEQHHNVGRAAFDHLQLGEGKIPQMCWRSSWCSITVFLLPAVLTHRHQDFYNGILHFLKKNTRTFYG